MDKGMMSYTLDQIKEIQEKLQVVGVAPDQIPEVIALLSRYGDLQEDLRGHRSTQFSDDAHMLLGALRHEEGKMYLENKMNVVCTFLRNFAEHVAIHMADSGQWVPKDSDDERFMVDLIDRIPVMNPRSARPPLTEQ